MKDLIKDRKFIIAVHENLVVGPPYDLRIFLLEKPVEKLIYISHPLTSAKEFYKDVSKCEVYKRCKLTQKIKAFHWRLPDPLLYVKDVFYTIFWSVRFNEKHDLFIGVDPLNALAGLILRFFGRVEKVIYYAIDYFTPRFENKILNYIYHSIDKLCVRFCDETWNLSDVMATAREKYNNMPVKIYNRQHTVPVGIWFYRAKRKEFAKINKKKIIFTGHLNPVMGVDLILHAMPKIIKNIPDIKLEIIGGGQEYDSLRKLANDLNLDRYVLFHGWIEDRKKLENLLSDAALGLAPFNTKIPGDKIRNADPAKLKDYALLGIPFIVTDAIANPQEITDKKCGIVINYDKDQLAKAVIKLLTNQKMLKEYRDNALKFVKKYDNGALFTSNLKRILKKEITV